MAGQHTYLVRAARPDEIDLLPEIEDRAAELYNELGMPEVAAMPGLSAAEFDSAQAAGHLLVVVDDDGRPVGFALVELIARRPHLRELNVLPEHGRRGLGRRLLDAVLTWAVSQGHAQLTLTTFRDVPWNALWYRRVGFEELPLASCSPELRRQTVLEAAAIQAPRVLMAKVLRSAGSAK